jgi:hypothetical protein
MTEDIWMLIQRMGKLTTQQQKGFLPSDTAHERTGACITSLNRMHTKSLAGDTYER